MTKVPARAQVIRRPRGSRKKETGDTEFDFFATTFKGVEKTLANELKSLGALNVRQSVRGVAFRGTMSTMYRVNLWSRTAHRVLWPIATFPCRDKDELYDGVRAVKWSDHMFADQTLAVDTVGTNENLIHTKYSSLLVKDGIVDWFRDLSGTRPNVDVRSPDLRINARINRNECTISWDTSGERLHKRGYRGEFGGEAPLKENLAAAILMMSGYDGTTTLTDPMCGSGTLLVEAAMIAENRAPGSLGRGFGFTAHPTFEQRRWANMKADAQSEVREVDGCPVVGYDASDRAVRNTQAAAMGSGTDSIIRVKRQDITRLPQQKGGMVVINPPYGERLNDTGELVGLYSSIGETLKKQCQGSSAHIITSSRFLASKIGLRPRKSEELWNGPLECRLLHYDLF